MGVASHWRRPKCPAQETKTKEKAMRFMMIVKASRESEAGVMPTDELLATMGKFNEELLKAGVLVDLSGLQPSSKGFRVKFSGGKRAIVDGPFAESKELIAGYWVINVKSREEALEWASKVPAPQERAGFMSLMSAVQHLSSSAGAVSSSLVLTTGAAGELIGIAALGTIAMAVAALVPALFWSVERRVARPAPVPAVTVAA